MKKFDELRLLEERLRAAGQKAFAADTVSALRLQLDLEPLKPLVDLKPSELPRQRWEAPEVFKTQKASKRKISIRN